MSKILRSYVKSHTVVKGTKGADDCIERLEFFDGTMIESKVHHSDHKESMQSYEIVKTDIPCFQGVEKIYDQYR